MKKLLFCLLVAFGISKSLNAQEFVIADIIVDGYQRISPGIIYNLLPVGIGDEVTAGTPAQDRKSTRLNSSHITISYAVFC